MKIWIAANKERVAKNKKEWGKKNMDRKRRASAKWAKGHPEQVRINSSNRNAIKKHARTGRLSNNLAKKLFELQRGKCACCHIGIEGGYHLDHNMPLALGGAHEDKNIQLLCPSCNLSKHAKHPIDFMQSRGFLL